MKDEEFREYLNNENTLSFSPTHRMFKDYMSFSYLFFTYFSHDFFLFILLEFYIYLCIFAFSSPKWRNSDQKKYANFSLSVKKVGGSWNCKTPRTSCQSKQRKCQIDKKKGFWNGRCKDILFKKKEREKKKKLDIDRVKDKQVHRGASFTERYNLIILND